MTALNEVKNELDKLRFQLRSLDGVQENIRYDDKDPEQDLQYTKVIKCLNLVEDLEHEIKMLTAKVLVEGELYLNENERYEVDGFELNSGFSLEYWDGKEWRIDRIEHFNGNYGLYYTKKHDLDGLYVRVRQIR